jgi:hypothetical protein
VDKSSLEDMKVLVTASLGQHEITTVPETDRISVFQVVQKREKDYTRNNLGHIYVSKVVVSTTSVNQSICPIPVLNRNGSQTV